LKEEHPKHNQIMQQLLSIFTQVIIPGLIHSVDITITESSRRLPRWWVNPLRQWKHPYQHQ
jgi:hypothetical protein